MPALQIRCPKCKTDFPLRVTINEDDCPRVVNLDAVVCTIRCRRCQTITGLTGRDMRFSPFDG